MKKLICAVACATVGAIALTGCGGSGTGLIRGTIDNSVAGSMFVGMTLSDAQSGFNGKPLESYPYYKGGECVYYRGVNVSLSNGFEATGTVWRFCFHNDKLAVLQPVCPIPWKPGEFARYKSDGDYSANPTDCHR
jgi:hypothetical protein